MPANSTSMSNMAPAVSIKSWKASTMPGLISNCNTERTASCRQAKCAPATSSNSRTFPESRAPRTNPSGPRILWNPLTGFNFSGLNPMVLVVGRKPTCKKPPAAANNVTKPATGKTTIANPRPASRKLRKPSSNPPVARFKPNASQFFKRPVPNMAKSINAIVPEHKTTKEAKSLLHATWPSSRALFIR